MYLVKDENVFNNFYEKAFTAIEILKRSSYNVYNFRVERDLIIIDIVGNREFETLPKGFTQSVIDYDCWECEYLYGLYKCNRDGSCSFDEPTVVSLYYKSSHFDTIFCEIDTVLKNIEEWVSDICFRDSFDERNERNERNNDNNYYLFP